MEWAVQAVSKRFGTTLTRSRFYQTPAFPAGSGPDYVNAVAQFSSALDAVNILAGLHEVEAEAGRERLTRWGQRTLDIDLIACGQSVAPDLTEYERWRQLSAEKQTKVAPDQLILPHPRMQDRAFVLVPLCDVAPDWMHPVLGQTARDLCEALDVEDRRSVVQI